MESRMVNMEFKNGKQNCRWKRYNVRMVKMEFKDG